MVVVVEEVVVVVLVLGLDCVVETVVGVVGADDVDVPGCLYAT